MTNTHHQRTSKMTCHGGCLCVRKIIISITEEIEINSKTNRYAKSIVENIAQRFPNESVTFLNAFEIFNFELHRIFYLNRKAAQ